MNKYYKSKEEYFRFKNGKYELVLVMPKRATIVIMPTEYYVDTIEIEKEYTFQELKMEVKGVTVAKKDLIF